MVTANVIPLTHFTRAECSNPMSTTRTHSRRPGSWLNVGIERKQFQE